MSDVLQTDEHAYRACILYETLRKKPIEETFKNLKEVMPNIDYFDFQYWFNRFLNGNHDLSHDRSKDPKTRHFSDMPMDVIEKIVDNLNLVDKLSTRKVCRGLRTTIDQQRLEVKRVHFVIDKNSCTIFFEQQLIRYCSQSNETCLVGTPQRTRSIKGTHLEIAITDFYSVINNPNWKFHEIIIGFDHDFHANLFVSMHHQIHVEKLNITASTLQPVITLLPHFNANELQHLLFDCDKFEENLLEMIMEMDHWKNIGELTLGTIPDWFPFEICFTRRNLLFFSVPLRTTVLKKLEIREPRRFPLWALDEEDVDLDKLIDTVDRVMGAHTSYDPDEGHYRIKDSNDYLDIDCQRESDIDEVVLEIKRVHV